MKLRVSEIFGGVDPNTVSPVLQGEGYYVGKPSIFVRTFGCNFRCRNFGVFYPPLDGKNKEVEEIINNLSSYDTLHDLPLVKTGCDSYFSIYPEFRKFTTDYTPEELNAVIWSRQPVKEFSQCDVIFTGGEPLLNQLFFRSVIPLLDSQNQKRITFETNGTVCLAQSTIDIMNKTQIKYLWSVSPKLAHSGHTFFETFLPEVLRTYNKVKNSILVLKFVISKATYNEEELFKFIKGYSENGVEVEDVFLMPEGGMNDDRYLENREFVIDLCCRYGFRYSPRLQLELYDNKVGT